MAHKTFYVRYSPSAQGFARASSRTQPFTTPFPTEAEQFIYVSSAHVCASSLNTTIRYNQNITAPDALQGYSTAQVRRGPKPTDYVVMALDINEQGAQVRSLNAQEKELLNFVLNNG